MGLIPQGHGRHAGEGRGWNARERTIIAKIKQYLERSSRVKVQVEALEEQLGPDDVDVDLRRIRAKYFETFGSNDTSFKVAEWSSTRDGWWQASLGKSQEQLTVSWSQDENKGDRRSGRLFGKVRPIQSKN